MRPTLVALPFGVGLAREEHIRGRCGCRTPEDAFQEGAPRNGAPATATLILLVAHHD
jgi:hypothetical protein